MKKILVIGCPGSGKSTFSKALHRMTGIALYHLDNLYWNQDKTTVSREVFLDRLNRILPRQEWIIDGNYASTMELRMQHCDTVIFLDYPAEVCLAGIRARHGKPRSDIPWLETGEDPEFIQYIKTFQAEGRPGILALLETYAHKNIFIFSSRQEETAFLSGKKP